VERSTCRIDIETAAGWTRPSPTMVMVVTIAVAAVMGESRL